VHILYLFLGNPEIFVKKIMQVDKNLKGEFPTAARFD